MPDLYLFVPVLDGPDGLLPDLSSKLLSEGHFSKIPFIAGTVLDEDTDLVPKDISNDDELFTFLIDAVSPYPHEVTSQLEHDLKALRFSIWTTQNWARPSGPATRHSG